ncbi:hypothetical protein HK098_000254 [Nowakowskiella sp. JEL0407]|nr:hypothetical protein HK098_000254 [Nowakowskiella sp. JEL0407]
MKCFLRPLPVSAVACVCARLFHSVPKHAQLLSLPSSPPVQIKRARLRTVVIPPDSPALPPPPHNDTDLRSDKILLDLIARLKRLNSLRKRGEGHNFNDESAMHSIWKLYISLIPFDPPPQKKPDPPPQLSPEKRKLLLRFPRHTVLTLLNVAKKFRSLNQRVQCTNKVLSDFQQIGFDFELEGYHARMLIERDTVGSSERVKAIFDELATQTVPIQKTFDLMLDVIARDLGPWAAEKWLEEALSRGIEDAQKAAEAETGIKVEKLSFTSESTPPYHPILTVSPRNLSIKNLIPENMEISDTETTPVSKKFYPGVATFTILMKAHCDNGNLDRALILFKKLRELGSIPTQYTWAILLDGFAKAGDFVGMKQWYQKMLVEGFTPNQAIYETLIYAYMNRAIDAAWIDPDEVEDDVHSSSNQPDTAPQKIPHTLEKPPHSCFTRKQNRKHSFNKRLQQAMIVYKDMRLAGYVPGVYTYSIFMLAYMRLKDFKSVESLFTEMQQNHITPDTTAYNLLMKSRFNANDSDGAMSILSHMMSDPSCPPNLYSFSICVDGLARSGNLEKAIEIFRVMQDQKIPPSIITMNMLLHGCCAIGDIPKASEVWKEYGRRGFVPSTMSYNILIFGYAVANDVDGAKRVFDLLVAEASWEEKLWKQLEKSETVNPLLKARFTQWLPDERQKYTRLGPSVETYNIMIGAHIRVNDTNGALNWYLAMNDARVEPDVVTFTLLIKSQLSAMNAIGAATAFRMLLQKNLRPTKTTFFAMIRCLALTKDFERAELVQKALIQFLETEENTKKSSLVSENNNLISEESLRDLSIMPYNLMIQEYARQKEYDRFNAQLEEAQKHGVLPNVRTYDILIRAFGRARDTVNARKWFDIALGDGRIKADKRLFESMIYAYEKSGQFKESAVTYDDMQRYLKDNDIYLVKMFSNE